MTAGIARYALLALVLLTMSALTNACLAVTAGLHLTTAHFNGYDEQVAGKTEHRSFRSETPGLYVRLDGGALAGLTVGTFRNSLGRSSRYSAWTWETADRRFALTAGAVTGYRDGGFSPLLAPSARVALLRCTALRISFLPKPPRNGSSAALHLTVESDL